ncbi:oxygenase MpaB family protein [Pseudonocardia sp. CA-107938]|uniref:oxygenase MpaB family protein n=1 Tax=Pseudonocardia sp. CA-107938 TaxID=3240021 RepID=UPI003D93FE91
MRAGDELLGIGLLAGAANVVMQLARPPVGYGVVESTVESGQLFRHPLKRARTTFTYLAVALAGTDAERLAYRRAVNAAHTAVRSTAASPVAYNAFDPDLQLWVAGCLYRGVVDVRAAFLGPDDPATADHVYASSAALGTTLQVPPERWPADRHAFDRWWECEVESVSMDDTVRAYLTDLVLLRFLPRPLAILFGPAHRFVTAGFLPPRFRAELHLDWDDRRQRRFDRAVAIARAVVRRLPEPVRAFPFPLLLWDLRRRIRTGRPLV